MLRGAHLHASYNAAGHKASITLISKFESTISRHLLLLMMYIDGLVQDCSISIANALEILQSCIKPSIYDVHTFLRLHRGILNNKYSMVTVKSLT